MTDECRIEMGGGDTFGVEAAGRSQEVSFFSVVYRWLPAQRSTPVLDDSKKVKDSAQPLKAIMPKTKKTQKSRTVIAITSTEEKLLALTAALQDGQQLQILGFPNE